MKNTFQQQLPRPIDGAFARGSRARKRNAGPLQLFAATTALTALVGLAPAQAGDVTYNFDSGQPADLTIGGNNDGMFVAEGGNPAGGGFLALTWPEGSQTGIVLFPNIDPGKILTGFTFTCDLRVGNSTGDRAADGFSISFGRTGDPFFDDLSDSQLAGNCCAETGTKTGIAVSFDTWSGNVFPNDPNDQTDIEGIIVRVDNVTVKKVSLPTRHGAADDITSLQTGPRDAQYWADGGDPRAAASWATLAWRPFGINLTPEGKLTVSWKGNNVLDNFQTEYFPSGGQLVFAGRTGGANEHTHVDNVHLITIAQAGGAAPGAPPNLKVAEVGSHRVALDWDAATVAGDPEARVAYEVERDGTVIAATVTGTDFVDRGVAPNTSYTYKVRGKNIADLKGPDSTVTTKTVTDVPGVAFLVARQWTGITGGTIDAGIGDPHFLDPADRTRFVNGFSFGETSNFGDTWGENHLVQIDGVWTPSVSGSYRFFVRSDDGSGLFINTAGAALPDVTTGTPVAMESGCCGAFEEPTVVDGARNEATSDPIALVAGNQYGISFLVKEGGGGDWGQVAVRMEGDLTPASSLTPLRGSSLSGPVDAVGASVAITTQPVGTAVSANDAASFSVVAAGSSAYGADYGNAISYQWYNNGVAVLNANSATYTIPVAPESDNGHKIKVTVAVAGANVTSDEVTLVVNPDAGPPTVTSITVQDGFNSRVVFNEPVKDPSATTTANYTVTGLTVSGVTRVNDRTVILTTTEHASDTVYPVTVNGVLDNANKPSAFSGTFRSLKVKTGGALFSYWDNETGGFDTFANITRPADGTSVVTEFASPVGRAENFFGRLQGIWKAPTTGNYVFWCAADDHGELYLSTDANPANKKRIAVEPEWSNPKKWIGDGTDADANTDSRIDANGLIQNRSDQYPGTQWAGGATINLSAGKEYYLEFLYKEGGGGDHGSATYTIAGAADPANDVTAIVGEALRWYEASAVVVPPEFTGITLNPDGTITVTWTGTATLQASPTLGTGYTDVTGATSPYTFTPTAATLFGRLSY